MSQETLYTIRDPSGATYGPANVALLRQWIAEGRITPLMHLAPQGTMEFVPASQIPELSDAFAPAAMTATASAPGSAPASPETYPGGAAGSQQAAYASYQVTNGMAIASLICSILTPMFCGIPGILGIIFGHMARKQIRREPDRYTGDGMALAGIIIGYCLTGLYAMLIIVYIIFIVVVISSAGHP